jgi:hypothetical protein
MSRNRSTSALPTLTLALLLSACGTGTEPTDAEPPQELDTEAVLADFEALDAVMTTADLASFRAIGGGTALGGAPAAVGSVTEVAAPTSASDGRRFALDLAGRLGSAHAARPAGAPIISDTHRAATFVYDAPSGDWVVDPAREGAPETGVRFVLYEVDEAGTPIVDEEIGWADLIDEGDSSVEGVALRLQVVAHGESVLDYRTRLDENADRGLLTVHGWLVGNGVRLDFDIEAVGRDTEAGGRLDVAFDLRVDARGFSITGDVHGVEENDDGEGDIDVTVRHRTQSLRVDVHGSEGEIEGTISMNGDVFATASGPADEPVLLGRSGEPLTFWERHALRRVIDAFEDVFDLLEDLVDPVEDLVFLGIIL